MRFQAVLLAAHGADKNVGSVWFSWCSYFIYCRFSVKRFLFLIPEKKSCGILVVLTCLEVCRFSKVQLTPGLCMGAKLRHRAATSNLEDVKCEEVCCCCCWLGVPPCECLL